MVRDADENEDMDCCQNLLKSLSKDDRDLATAVKNVSTENNVMEGGSEIVDNPSVKCNRSKEMLRVGRQTVTGWSGATKKWMKEMTTVRLRGFQKDLSFDEEDQEKSTKRNGDDEKRVDEPSESVATGESDEKITVMRKYHDITMKRLIGLSVLNIRLRKEIHIVH